MPHIPILSLYEYLAADEWSITEIDQILKFKQIRRLGGYFQISGDNSSTALLQYLAILASNAEEEEQVQVMAQPLQLDMKQSSTRFWSK